MDVLIGTAAWNEGEKIVRLTDGVLAFIESQPAGAPYRYRFLVVDDGSTDTVASRLAACPGVEVVRNERNLGAGAAVRTIYRMARAHGCHAAVTIAGNGKDDPREIPRLLAGLEQGLDLVQGSRYLDPPSAKLRDAMGDMPRYRYYATRYLHPLLFRLSTGRRLTDTTNGFRALRLSVLDDARIDLDQPWLDRYELEVYLLHALVTLGYRVGEAPVRKIYPDRAIGYSKMAPLRDWWRMLAPLLYLRLGLRR